MTMRQRVYRAYVICWISFILGILAVALLTMSNGKAGWPLVAWTWVWGVAVLFVLDRVTRCPFCGTRLLRPGLKPDLGRFAYIRCQSCRKRFDGRVGPDPEISDEAIAQGDPLLLDHQVLQPARTPIGSRATGWAITQLLTQVLV